MKFKEFIQDRYMLLESMETSDQTELLYEGIFDKIKSTYNKMVAVFEKIFTKFKNLFSASDMKVIQIYFDYELQPIVLTEDAKTSIADEAEGLSKHDDVKLGCKHLIQQRKYLNDFLEVVVKNIDLVKKSDLQDKSNAIKCLTTLLHYINNQLSSLNSVIFILQEDSNIDKTIYQMAIDNKLGKIYRQLWKDILNINIFDRTKTKEKYYIWQSIGAGYWNRLVNIFKHKDAYNDIFKGILSEAIDLSLENEKFKPIHSEVMKRKLLFAKTQFIDLQITNFGTANVDISVNDIDEVLKTQFDKLQIEDKTLVEQLLTSVVKNVITLYSKKVKSITELIGNKLTKSETITDWFKTFICRGGLINDYKNDLECYINKLVAQKLNKFVSISIPEENIENLNRVDMYNKYIQYFNQKKLEILKEMKDIFSKSSTLTTGEPSDSDINTLYVQGRKYKLNESDAYDTLMRLSYYVINLVEDSSNKLELAKTVESSGDKLKAQINKILMVSDIEGEYEFRNIMTIKQFLRDASLQKKLLEDIKEHNLDVKNIYSFIFSTGHRPGMPRPVKGVPPSPIVSSGAHHNKKKEMTIQTFLNIIKQKIHNTEYLELFKDDIPKFDAYWKELETAASESNQKIDSINVDVSDYTHKPSPHELEQLRAEFKILSTPTAKELISDEEVPEEVIKGKVPTFRVSHTGSDSDMF